MVKGAVFVQAVLPLMSHRYEFESRGGNDKKNLLRKFGSSEIVGNFSDQSVLTLSSLYQFDPMEQCSE